MKRGRNQRRRQGVNINRALDSNGPDVRIRGTANQIYDKYQALARDASSSGDRVKAENYLQHAEHYFRLIRSIQPAQPQPNDSVDADGDQPSIDGGGERPQRRREPDNADAADDEGDRNAGGASGAENGADHGDGDQRRQRRQRRPRRTPRDEQSASDESEEEEPAEAAVS